MSRKYQRQDIFGLGKSLQRAVKDVVVLQIKDKENDLSRLHDLNFIRFDNEEDAASYLLAEAKGATAFHQGNMVIKLSDNTFYFFDEGKYNKVKSYLTGEVTEEKGPVEYVKEKAAGPLAAVTGFIASLFPGLDDRDKPQEKIGQDDYYIEDQYEDVESDLYGNDRMERRGRYTYENDRIVSRSGRTRSSSRI